MSHSPADSTKLENATIPKNEEWRPIPGFPNYEASSEGRIRSVRVRVLKQRFNHVTLRDDPQYPMVHIKNRYWLVHRLVAAAFIGELPPGRIVHHRDNNKANARPENLMHVTPSENTKWAYADGRIGSHYKLNPFQRAKVVELYTTRRHTTAQLAAQFGVSKDVISYLIKNAGHKLTWRKKLGPALYEEIRSKWVPYKYPVSALAKEYKVSRGMIEFILGMRVNRKGGIRLPQPVENSGQTVKNNP